MPFKRNSAALDAPAHPHEFPRIAKEMGFNFSLRRGRVDWYKIDSINIDRLVQDRDLVTLQENLLNVINYNLDSEYDVKILDPNFVKLFKLAQLSIDYLMYSEQHLYNCIELLHENNTKLSAELRGKEEELEKKEVYIKILKKRVKENNTDLNHHMNGAGDQSKCDHCGKTFLNSVYLAAHHYRRHPSSPSPSPAAADETSSALRSEVARLRDEMQRLKEKTRLLEAGDATQHQALSRNQETSQRAADEWQERLEQKYHVQFMSMKSMLLEELRNLQKSQAEGVLPSPSTCTEPEHQPQPQAAVNLESLKGQMETFSDNLTRLQEKSKKEIDDLRAQVKKNESNKKFDTENQSTLQALVEHKAKQEEILSLQAQQILQLSRQNARTSPEAESYKMPPSAPKKSSSAVLPVTVYKPFENPAEKTSVILNKVANLDETSQTLHKQTKPDTAAEYVLPKSTALSLSTVNVPTMYGSDSEPSETRSSSRKSETYRVNQGTNTSKGDVEIVDMSSSESSAASSDDTISNDVEHTNVEYFDGRQSPMERGNEEVNKTVTRDGGDASTVVLNNVRREELPIREVSSKVVPDRLESLLQRTGIKVMMEAGKLSSENPPQNSVVMPRTNSENVYRQVDGDQVYRGFNSGEGDDMRKSDETVTGVNKRKSDEVKKGDDKRNIDETLKGDDSRKGNEIREDDIKRDGDEESEETVTEDSSWQSSVDLALHSAVSLANAVAQNPRVLAELKVDINKQFERRLHELGVDPEWSRIPRATFSRNLETVKHHANVTSKRYRSYFKIREDLINNVEKQLLRSKQTSGAGDVSKTRNVNKKIKSRSHGSPVKNLSSIPVGDGVNTPKILHRIPQREPKEIGKTQDMSIADKKKFSLPNKNKQQVMINSDKLNTEVPKIPQAFTSTPLKSNNFFQKPLDHFHSSVESIDSDSNFELTNASTLGIETVDHKIQTDTGNVDQQVSSTFIKSPRNLLSKSDNSLDMPVKPRLKVMPRGVLKGASSTGSLMTKKRVLFADHDEAPSGGFPVAAVRQDNPHTVPVSAVQGIRTIGLLGEGYDSDFDISSGPDTDEEENIKNNKPSKPNLVINKSAFM